MKPAELSEIVTHLAFYSGWANAMSAVAVAKYIFHQCGIDIDQFPPAKAKLLPRDRSLVTVSALIASGRWHKSQIT